MAKFNFSEKHIRGLIDYDERILHDVMSQIREAVQRDFHRRKLSEDDVEDMVTGVYYYAISLVHQKICISSIELETHLNKSIKKAAQIYGKKWRRGSGVRVNFSRVGDKSPRSLMERYYAESNLNEWLSKQSGKAELLYKDTRSEESEQKTEHDILIVDDELIRFFSKYPERMYQLEPRKFEELVAGILKDLGYDVELTAKSADGGIDIFATQKAEVGEVLLIVDCKRYSPTKHVGVEIVRAMYGIGERLRATMSMIATTSFFTRPAIEFQRSVKHRLSLKDHNDLHAWLGSYGQNTMVNKS
jgi:HJR/Mrr/RecB family endonuclease